MNIFNLFFHKDSKKVVVQPEGADAPEDTVHLGTYEHPEYLAVHQPAHDTDSLLSRIRELLMGNDDVSEDAVKGVQVVIQDSPVSPSKPVPYDVATSTQGAAVAEAVGTAPADLAAAHMAEGDANAVVETESGKVDLSGVSLAEKNFTLHPGDKVTLRVDVSPVNATDYEIGYQSNDESIATVDENGVVTAVAEGSVEIFAGVSDEIHDAATVTVIAAEAEAEPVEDEAAAPVAAETEAPAAPVAEDDAPKAE